MPNCEAKLSGIWEQFWLDDFPAGQQSVVRASMGFKFWSAGMNLLRNQ